MIDMYTCTYESWIVPCSLKIQALVSQIWLKMYEQMDQFRLIQYRTYQTEQKFQRSEIFRMDEWNSKIKKMKRKKPTTYNWNEEVMKV